ncbi:GGDEF domain-containing protein [Actinoplanes sp. DH11]|uniref:GGDEF domain-containing protein n=1 Tax=Actinoplanes sp. DH11 TaxID=2857011 RepID=UPI001E495ACF|nr:GGDEF domain-containing protein [Actinoplanes sp. DH11]
MRLRTALLASLGLATAVQLTHPVLPEAAGYALSDVIIALASGYAAVNYRRRARDTANAPRIRLAFGLGASAGAAWSASNVLFLLGVLGVSWVAAPAVVLSTVAAVLVPLAMVLAGPRLRGIAAARQLIDVAAVSGAFFALVRAFAPVGAGQSAFTGYAMTIVVVLGCGAAVALVTLATSEPGRGVSAQQLLAFAALVQAITLLISMRNSVAGQAWWADGVGGGYVLGALVMAVSSRLAVSRPGVDGVERLVFSPWALLPYVPVATAVGVAAARQLTDGELPPVLVWLLLSSFSLVLLRQFLTLVTVGRLTVTLEEQRTALAYQAHHDPLTGLLNRAAFDSRAAALLTAGYLEACAIVIDLDGFKPVNDTLGHAAGDEVLVTVAHRLTAELRGTDLVCRCGGDEFAVLMIDAGPRAGVVAGRLLRRISQPMVVQGRPVKVGGSVGVAVTRRGERVGVSALLRQADTAMYAAKAAGKGTIRRYASATA